MPNPIDNEELYDSIALGGVRSPGKVTLSGHNRKIDWDVKTVQGQAGANITLKSIPPVQFTATFYLVRDDALGIDDIEKWPSFLALINSTVNGTNPKAVDIYHPDLASNDIKSVVKAEVGGVQHDGKGGQTIAVQFLEYRLPKPKGGTPSGSKKSAGADPNQAALEELARLTKQYQDTPWG